jgi:hypothetical protein
MKLAVFMFLIANLIFGVSFAGAQSTGGGGGGDRMALINDRRPVQVIPERESCYELQTLLNYMGRLRLNMSAYDGTPVFKLTSARSAVECGSDGQIRPLYVQTADRSKCQLGFVCVQRP